MGASAEAIISAPVTANPWLSGLRALLDRVSLKFAIGLVIEPKRRFWHVGLPIQSGADRRLRR